MDNAGLITLPSKHSVSETIERLVAIAVEKNLQVFARVDHARNARDVGLELRPMELVIFGNPRAGTPLMQAVATMGIDLPVKALAWEDESGQAWLTYNDARWLGARHGLPASSEPTLSAIEAGMRLVAEAATR